MDLNTLKSKFKNKQDLTFLFLGILMSILVFIFIFYSINILTTKISDVLNAGKIAGSETIKFNIDKIKPLELKKLQK